MAKDLRLKPVHALGHLHALWHAALEQQESGDLSSWSDDLIAEVSCYSGDAPQYVFLLQQHGWLDGKRIHDWLDYAGNYLARKYHNTEPAKLRKIWVTHGRSYGKGTSLRKQKGNLDISDLISSPLPKKKGRGGEAKSAAEVPDWIDRSTWEAFREMRKEIKEPLTQRAEQMGIKKLDELRNLGHESTAVLEQSIFNNWKGLYPVKRMASANEDTQADRIRRRTEETLKRGLK